MLRRPLSSTLFPYTTLFRSVRIPVTDKSVMLPLEEDTLAILKWRLANKPAPYRWRPVWERMIELVSARVAGLRSEEHTSELQSRENLVCRLLLEKKKKIKSK